MTQSTVSGPSRQLRMGIAWYSLYLTTKPNIIQRLALQHNLIIWIHIVTWWFCISLRHCQILLVYHIILYLFIRSMLTTSFGFVPFPDCFGFLERPRVPSRGTKRSPRPWDFPKRTKSASLTLSLKKRTSKYDETTWNNYSSLMRFSGAISTAVIGDHFLPRLWIFSAPHT